MPKASARAALGVGLIAVCGGFVSLTAAHATPADVTPVPAASSQMPHLVEDFSYPGAEKIRAEQGITLKRGDGHITLTDCAASYDIMVKSRTAQKNYCFTVLGKTGLLTLELPDAFGLWTQQHPVQATLTADGKKTVVKAPANDYTPMGEAGATGVPSVLVELRVTS